MHILLIEDNPRDADLFKAAFHEDETVKIDVEDTIHEAIKRMMRMKYDILIVDLFLSGSAPEETLRIFDNIQGTLTIFLSGVQHEDPRVLQKDFLSDGNIPNLKRHLLEVSKQSFLRHRAELKKSFDGLALKLAQLNAMIESKSPKNEVIDARSHHDGRERD